MRGLGAAALTKAAAAGLRSRAVMRAADRRLLAAVAAIAALGLLLRIVFVLLDPDEDVQLDDAAEFHGLANAVADGRGFVSPFVPAGQPDVPTAHKPPLYPLLLAGVSALGGRSFAAHQVATAVLGAATVVVVALVAHRIAGRRAALLAAGLAAAYPVFLARDASLNSETLYALLLAVSLLLAIEVLARPSARRALALGAAIALVALTRSEGILLLLLLALPAVILGASQRRARLLALVVVGCLLVLTPWLVRCWVAFDRPVAITTNSGDVLAGANCEATYGGERLGQWALECLSGVTGQNEAARAARLSERGLRYAREHVDRLPAVAAARVLRPWGLFRPGQELRIESTPGAGSRSSGWPGLIACWLLVPLAVAGALAVRRRGGPLFVLLAPIALTLIVSATAYGTLRLRAPADVALLVLGAVGALALVQRLSARRRSTANSPKRLISA
jgi:4-amino-4-deoxy-L-arabinose transferase-like glycosyltransferase